MLARGVGYVFSGTNREREWKAGTRERERETRGEKQFGSARGRGRRTSNGATKLILQNAAFRSGKLLRSTSWRVSSLFQRSGEEGSIDSRPSLAESTVTRRGLRESFALGG